MANGAEKILYRLGSAAKLLDTSPETLRQIIRRGELRRLKIGRAVYVSREELDRFIARCGRAS